jgi:4-hydroxy-2-oxovalerate aldolase
MNKINILDCTLRDGSYLIDFQFNYHDTHFISQALATAGINYIEVGHGLGLDASKSKGSSLEYDLSYIKAAKLAAPHSLIGVFYIPGIGQHSTIKAAKDLGLDFIRVGVNITEYEQAKETVNFAKSLGLEVWINLMKSYSITPEEFKGICADIASYGADKLAIVDSAGGMTPNEVKRYVEIAKNNTRYEIGFHGHNNVQLAIANCLAAIEGGATCIDTTLYGMGRSGGNAATEIIASLLNRQGYNIGDIDTAYLIELATKVIAPLATKNISNYAAELAAGINYFHSSFYSLVKKHADINQVETFKTILALPKESRVTVTDEMCKETIKKVSPSQLNNINNLLVSDRIHLPLLSDLQHYLKEVSSKTHKGAVLSFALNKNLTHDYRISTVTLIETNLVGHIEVTNFETIKSFIDCLDGYIDHWVFENAFYEKSSQHHIDKFLYYNEKQLMDSVLYTEISLLNHATYVINNKEEITTIEKSEFSYLNLKTNTSGSKDHCYIISSQLKVLSQSLINKLPENSQLILIEKCQLSDDIWNNINQQNIKLIKLNYTYPLAHEIQKIIQYKELISTSRGDKIVGNMQLISGGKVKEKGAIVVDNVNHPTMIIGESDGYGGIQEENLNDEQLNKLKQKVFNLNCRSVN